MLKKSIANLNFLLFLNGFLVCLFVTLHIADNYENRIFTLLAKNIAYETQYLPEDSVVGSALHTSHVLIGTRSQVFSDHHLQFPVSTANYPASLSGDLMTGNDACGSYAKVMARLAQHLGFTTRIAQMKVNGNYGGHILTEVKTSKGWVVVDAMYNLRFKKRDGNWASFDDVSKDWDYFKSQTPAGYNPDYRYEGVRYTNWDKIPVLMPAVKKVMNVLIGERRTENFSLRSNLLSIYSLYANLLLLVIIPLSVYIIVKLTRLRMQNAVRLKPAMVR